jgi:hypothetical protein
MLQCKSNCICVLGCTPIYGVWMLSLQNWAALLKRSSLCIVSSKKSPTMYQNEHENNCVVTRVFILMCVRAMFNLPLSAISILITFYKVLHSLAQFKFHLNQTCCFTVKETGGSLHVPPCTLKTRYVHILPHFVLSCTMRYVTTEKIQNLV